MNTQNQLVADQINTVSTACEMLDELGITVLRVLIGEQSRAVIEIQHSRACARLESGLYMAITRDSQRLQERVAMFGGCCVRWKQRAA
jgi:hypothetical protein